MTNKKVKSQRSVIDFFYYYGRSSGPVTLLDEGSVRWLGLAGGVVN